MQNNPTLIKPVYDQDVGQQINFIRSVLQEMKQIRNIYKKAEAESTIDDAKEIKHRLYARLYALYDKFDQQELITLPGNKEFFSPDEQQIYMMRSRVISEIKGIFSIYRSENSPSINLDLFNEKNESFQYLLEYSLAGKTKAFHSLLPSPLEKKYTKDSLALQLELEQREARMKARMEEFYAPKQPEPQKKDVIHPFKSTEISSKQLQNLGYFDHLPHNQGVKFSYFRRYKHATPHEGPIPQPPNHQNNNNQNNNNLMVVQSSEKGLEIRAKQLLNLKDLIFINIDFNFSYFYEFYTFLAGLNIHPIFFSFVFGGCVQIFIHRKVIWDEILRRIKDSTWFIK